jgi:chromosome segregation ATPase
LEALQEERKSQLAELEKQVADLKEQAADLEKAREKELDSLKSSLKVTSDAEKEKVNELNKSLTELQDIRTSRDATVQEVENLKMQLEQANKDFSAKEKAAFKTKEQEFAAHKEQVEKLNERIQELASSGSNSSDNINKSKKQLREAQIALVSLDDEVKQMSAKHRQLLFAVEKKKEDNMRDFSEKLDAKEKELAELRNLQEKASRVYASNGPSPKEESLRAELKTAKYQGEELNEKMQTLKNDKETQVKALKAKLKDRDTTMTALVRSSVSMEQKIASMERSGADGDLSQLRKAVATTKESEMQLSNEISALQKEIHSARADAERWRAALEQDGGGKINYRYQITMMQKDLEENHERLQERDSAIENLVIQSMTQESHVKDLKTRISSLMKETETLRLQKNKSEDSRLKAEISRLQQESEIFAGQIIEQDEEMENLKRDVHVRDEQVVALKKVISELKSRGSQVDASELKLRDQQVSALKLEISMLQADMKTRLTELANEKIKMAELQSVPSTAKNDSKRVIELQAEIDELQEAQETNRTELRDLRRQLWQAKEAAGEAGDLKVELAQAKYAMDEVQREAKAKVEAAQKEARDAVEVRRQEVDQSGLSDREELREQLDESISKNKALETRMASQLENLRRLKNEAVEKLEIKLVERDETIERLKGASTNLNEEQIQIFQNEVEKLRQDLSSKSEELERLQKQLKDTMSSLETSEASKQQLSQELDSNKAAKDTLEKEMTKTMHELDSNKAAKDTLEKEMAKTMHDMPNSDDVVKAKEALEMEVANLNTELAFIKQDQENYEELKTQLEQEKGTRASAEKSIVESYERQLNAINMNKDVTIDELRKNLTESRGKSSEDIIEMTNAIRSLESENDGLKEQLEAELNAKNQQIYVLEHALHAQEQQLDNMRVEMDQLQSGMEFATQKRRGEAEEMQQEVMEINSRANKQEREIVALKMQLEEHKLEHKSEVVRLKDVIATLESESPLAQTVAQLQNDDRMLEVRERLEQLKWKNTELQEANLKLNGRLERAMLASKSLESEKEHSEDLEKEIRKLSRQVKTLEGILEGAKRPRSSAAAPVPASARPSKTAVDKENATNEPVASTKRTASATPPQSRVPGSPGKKKGLGGLFKRKTKSDVSTISTEQIASKT